MSQHHNHVQGGTSHKVIVFGHAPKSPVLFFCARVLNCYCNVLDNANCVKGTVTSKEFKPLEKGFVLLESINRVYQSIFTVYLTYLRTSVSEKIFPILELRRPAF